MLTANPRSAPRSASVVDRGSPMSPTGRIAAAREAPARFLAKLRPTLAIRAHKTKSRGTKETITNQSVLSGLNR